MSSSKRFILIVNPYGGMKKGLQVLEQIRPVFEEGGAELEIRETEYGGHARDLINNMDLSGYDGFCGIGGDGTMHEMVNGLLAREDGVKIPVGLVPAGTGNSFMHDMECLDPVEAAKRIVAGNTQVMDVAAVSMGADAMYAFHMIGWGMVTDITVLSEKIRWLGQGRYTVSTIIEVLKMEKRQAKFIIDGEEIEDEFVFAVASNTRYIGGTMMMCPRAKLDDGLLDLVVVREGGRLKLLRVFPKVFDGSHVQLPIVEYYQVKEFSIIPEEDDVLNIDGELAGETPIHVKMVPGAFQVFA